MRIKLLNITIQVHLYATSAFRVVHSGLAQACLDSYVTLHVSMQLVCNVHEQNKISQKNKKGPHYICRVTHIHSYDDDQGGGGV